ncbi:hypothetical protein [Kangiella sp. M94]
MIKDIIISICALGGLALGLHNLFRDTSKEKVCLRVKPLSFHWMPDGKTRGITENGIHKNRHFETIGLKVVNLSKFDLTIIEAGFTLNTDDDTRLAFPEALVLESSNTLPAKISSRESIELFFIPEQLPQKGKRLMISGVYVHTACELEFFGSGKVIEDFSKT